MLSSLLSLAPSHGKSLAVTGSSRIGWISNLLVPRRKLSHQYIRYEVASNPVIKRVFFEHLLRDKFLKGKQTFLIGDMEGKELTMRTNKILIPKQRNPAFDFILCGTVEDLRTGASNQAITIVEASVMTLRNHDRGKLAQKLRSGKVADTFTKLTNLPLRVDSPEDARLSIPSQPDSLVSYLFITTQSSRTLYDQEKRRRTPGEEQL
ncbi:hypothetical protein QOT17_016592 [Balamuthia mandrillaris]